MASLDNGFEPPSALSKAGGDRNTGLTDQSKGWQGLRPPRARPPLRGPSTAHVKKPRLKAAAHVSLRIRAVKPVSLLFERRADFAPGFFMMSILPAKRPINCVAADLIFSAHVAHVAAVEFLPDAVVSSVALAG